MRMIVMFSTSATLLALSVFAYADSLWSRRNPYHAGLFRDVRARKVGDLVTIVVREATIFNGREDRKMKKDTSKGILFNLKGAFAGQGAGTEFSGETDGTATSRRQLNGKADYQSDRTLLDRVTVQVVDVMPNGNLVIQGYRERIIARERKTVFISGIVHPKYIGPNNVVESQYIANFTISYTGSGEESSYLQHGFLGRILNKLWPY